MVWSAGLAACLVGALSSALAQSGSGLRLPSDGATNSSASTASAAATSWKGRIGLDWGAAAAQGSGLVGNAGTLAGPALGGQTGLKLNSLRLLGDYYFAPGSGFRATGGLLRGSLGAPWMLTGGNSGISPVDLRWTQSVALPGTSGAGLRLSSSDASTPSVPYVGAGYSLDLNQTWGGNWSFSADVGLVALNPGSAVKLGHVFNGSQNFDDVLREMRLSPIVQFGVSYSY